MFNAHLEFIKKIIFLTVRKLLAFITILVNIQQKKIHDLKKNALIVFILFVKFPRLPLRNLQLKSIKDLSFSGFFFIFNVSSK